MQVPATNTGLGSSARIFAVVLAVGLSLAAAAEAADIGWCGTPQELSALMQSEGQRSLASGNQNIRFEELPDGTFQHVDKEVGLIFTASEESRIGYMVQATSRSAPRQPAPALLIAGIMCNCSMPENQDSPQTH